MVTGPWRA